MTAHADDNPDNDFREVQAAFAEHLRNPAATPAPPGLRPERLKVYSDAVFLNALGLVSENFPSLAKLYPEDAWHRFVREYLAEHRSRSPAFVRVPWEFLAYVERRAQEGRGDPPFLPELAHFECLETEIGADLRRHDLTGIDPAGDLLAGTPVANPIMKIVRYAYPVHAIDETYRPAAPPPAPTFIAAFRTTGNRYRFLDVNPLTAALLERLAALPEAGPRSRPSGAEVLAALAADHGIEPARVMEHGPPLYERMRDVGAVLGVAKGGDSA